MGLGVPVYPYELQNLTDAEIQQLQAIGATTIIAAQWGYLGAMDQGVATTDAPHFNGLSIPANATPFYMGAADDYSIEWDGSDAVHTITVGAIRVQKDAIGTTLTSGLVLQNDTAAADGAQQYSPGLQLTGHGWSGEADQARSWRISTQPYQGQSSYLYFEKQDVAGGAWTSVFTIGGSGPYFTTIGQLSIQTSGIGAIYAKVPENLVLTLGNQSFDDFDRLQFGGTTSAFPALKRVGADLQVISADGSSNSNLLVTGSRHLGTTGGVNRRVTEATGTAGAAATFDIEVDIPSGARILGCQLRVDTILTSGDGGVSWTAAYIDGATAQIGTGLAFAQNTKHNQLFDCNAATDITSAETDIRVTCDGGKTFEAGGVVRAIVYYEDLTAMANAA